MAGEQERILQIPSEANSSVENESSALEDNVKIYDYGTLCKSKKSVIRGNWWNYW